jgi:hypothetical protein
MSRVNVYVYAKVFGSSEAPIGEIIAENGVGEEYVLATGEVVMGYHSPHLPLHSISAGLSSWR